MANKTVLMVATTVEALIGQAARVDLREPVARVMLGLAGLLQATLQAVLCLVKVLLAGT